MLFRSEGYNKDQADQFYKSSIEGTKRRIEGVGGAQHYKAMVPDMDYMVKTGQAKPMSSDKVADAQKVRKEQVVKAAGNKKNFNVNRSNNTQSSK